MERFLLKSIRSFLVSRLSVAVNCCVVRLGLSVVSVSLDNGFIRRVSDLSLFLHSYHQSSSRCRKSCIRFPMASQACSDSESSHIGFQLVVTLLPLLPQLQEVLNRPRIQNLGNPLVSVLRFLPKTQYFKTSLRKFSRSNGMQRSCTIRASE